MKDRISWQGTLITDTFAEAFSVTGTRIIITAGSEKWAEIAAYEVTGYGTSVIACDAEAGIDTYLTPEQTPDGRPGVAVMLFAFNLESLAKAVLKRVGQCILTCPTTAVFDGVEESTDAEKRIDLGKQLLVSLFLRLSSINYSTNNIAVIIFCKVNAYFRFFFSRCI